MKSLVHYGLSAANAATHLHMETHSRINNQMHLTNNTHIEACQDFLLALNAAGWRKTHVPKIWKIELEPGISHYISKSGALLTIDNQDSMQQGAAGWGDICKALAHGIHVRCCQILDPTQSAEGSNEKDQTNRSMCNSPTPWDHGSEKLPLRPPFLSHRI